MWATMRTAIDRLLAVADHPGDDDQHRLRKRVTIEAGVALVVARSSSILAQGHPLSWVIAIAMPAVGIANLLVLARTGAFERYAQVLVLMVLLFPAAIEVLLGRRRGQCLASSRSSDPCWRSSPSVLDAPSAGSPRLWPS